MKKGDIRKQEILNTAEALFCKNGYEQTSIQDILNEIHSSKGSFYHHFPSKESLLESICRNRAEQAYMITEQNMKQNDDAVACLEMLLSGMIPLCHEKIGFLLMMLPVFSMPEGRTVKVSYSEALTDMFKDAVMYYLQKGHQSGMLFCTNPKKTTDLIMVIMNDLWIRICDTIVAFEGKNQDPDLSELLGTVDLYRFTIEKILSLPYGSLSLADITTLRSITEQIHNHWISISIN